MIYLSADVKNYRWWGGRNEDSRKKTKRDRTATLGERRKAYTCEEKGGPTLGGPLGMHELESENYISLRGKGSLYPNRREIRRV